MQHLLSYGMVTHLMLNISKGLVVSAIFLKSLGMENLMPKGIFIGYSTRSKAYKCLNVNTKKVVESANVKLDELAKVQNDECTKKIEEYKSFIYFYEGMPNEDDAANQNENQQQTTISAESQPVNAELQNVGNAHSDSKISTHERDEELHD